nr:cation-transporting P-type ATPase [Nitrospiraceae bacterium]
MDLPSSSASLKGTTSDGLSEEEARKRLEATGPNSVPLPEPSPGRLLLAKFWGPVPWMLETAFLLELATGKDLEALIVIFLLLMNGLLAFLKEEKGKAALRLLRNKMEVTARIRRDGLWKTVPAREIVPGDIVHVRQGDFVPADILLDSGTPL